MSVCRRQSSISFERLDDGIEEREGISLGLSATLEIDQPFQESASPSQARANWVEASKPSEAHTEPG